MPAGDLDAFVEELAARARALREQLTRAGGSRIASIAGLAGPSSPAWQTTRTRADAALPDAAHAAGQLFAYGVLCARWFALREGGGTGLSLLCDRLGGDRPAALWFERVGAAAGGFDAARAIEALVASADLDALFGADSNATPLAHSYERFLGAYDPALRRARGVYFTPAPVAAFVVRRVDRVLRDDLGLDLGLAAPVDATGAPVHILDPACGTGAFLAEVVHLAHRAFRARRATERAASEATSASEVTAWRTHVRDALLPRLHGIEVMPASYAVCHAHLALALAATGYRLATDDALDVRLADALAGGEALVPGAAVIVMNPPYRRGGRASGAAALATDDSHVAYREGLAGERNLQPLSDDYVRFVRLAQRQLAERPWGVVGMVGNSTFLSGRLYRGMRRSLGSTFDAVDIVDLHGSARKGRAAPGTPRDANVFDVGQGVAVVVMRRGGGGETTCRPDVGYAELRGSRAQKQRALEGDTLPAGIPVRPRAPYHLWVPAAEPPEEYAAFLPLDELFSFHSVGGKPGNDAVLVGFDPDDVLAQLQRARASLDAGATEAARKLARRPDDAPFERARVVPYAYRPFDTRFVYDEPAIWTRPVPALRRRLDGEPLLLTSRVVNDRAFAHVFASRILPDVILLSPTSSVNCHVFPASAIVVEPVARTLRRAMAPRTLFAYAYAILHSPTYRVRYAPALALDYPRIPLVRDATAFDALAALGADLLALHLLDASVAFGPEQAPRFVDGGDRRVTQAGDRRGELVDVRGDVGKLHVNAVSYFEPVSLASWQHRIGGYQVLRKWLADRKRAGRALRDDDIAHYRRVVASIGRSIALAERIDACIADHGGWPAAFTAAARAERT